MLSCYYRSSLNQTGACSASSSSPSLSLLFPQSAPSPSTSLLSPPLVPSAAGHNKRTSATAFAADMLQQLGAHQTPQQQQQTMAATISYLHSSLSMTPTSPQTSSTAGTPVPMDLGQMVFGSTTDQVVAKANSGRASVVVQQQPQSKVIPPPPSLIPMSAAGSLFNGLGGGGAGSNNKDLQKI